MSRTEALDRLVDRLNVFGEIPLLTIVRVGRASKTLGQLLALKNGDTFFLDSRVGEPFAMLVEGERVAWVDPIACEERVQLKIHADEEAAE